jgi:hypothetical protein
MIVDLQNVGESRCVGTGSKPADWKVGDTAAPHPWCSGSGWINLELNGLANVFRTAVGLAATSLIMPRHAASSLNARVKVPVSGLSIQATWPE